MTDAYGNGVKNYFGTVHFSTSAASAGLPADYTFNGADAGVHNFTLTLNTSGNQTLSVADVNNPLLNASGERQREGGRRQHRSPPPSRRRRPPGWRNPSR